MKTDACNIFAWFSNEIKPLILSEGKFFTIFP